MNMHSEQEFWERVQEILDHRGNPMDAPDVQAFCLDHPETIDKLIALEANLNLLEKVQPFITVKGAQRSRRFIALTAAGILACLLWTLWSPAGHKGQITPPSHSIILDYRIEITTTGPEGCRSIVHTPNGSTINRKTIIHVPAHGDDTFIAVAMIDETSSQRSLQP